MATSIDRIGERLAEVVTAIGALDGDVRAAGHLLGLLGWDLPPGVADIGLSGLDLTTVAARLDELVELRSQENASDVALATAAAAVVAALLDAYDQLADLADNLQATPEYLAATGIATEFFPRLADLVLIQMIGANAPALVPLGALLGVFEFEMMPADPSVFQVEHVRQRIRWDRLGPLLNDPASVPRDVYGWGTAQFAGDVLVTRIGQVLSHVSDAASLERLPRDVEEEIAGQPVPEADTQPASRLLASIAKGLAFDSFDLGLMLYPVRPSTPGGTDGGLALTPYAFGAVETSVDLSDTISLVVSADAADDLAGGLVLLLRPGADPELRTGMFGVPGSDPGDAGFGLTLRAAARPGERHRLFDGPVLSADAAELKAGVALTAGDATNPTLHASVVDGRVHVTPAGADGFLASVLPAEGITTTVNLDLSWSRRDGLRIHGGAGLRTTLTPHLRLGPIQVDTVELALTADTDEVRLGALVTAVAALGPFTATVGSVGAALVLRFERGNLGAADLGARFVPPAAIGLSLDAVAVSGGGTIRHEPTSGRYSGVLQLRAGQVAVTGMGILDTRLPGGAAGYALLVALRATFPAIQVGFGFALTSVGGLVALNRRVDVDALRSRLATGTAGRILAPADPVADAPALLADLGAVFPVAPGVTVIGPTAHLVWADLVHFDIGVFLELPGPTRVVLLGSARAAIEAGGRVYLSIRFDIVGVIDALQGTAAFDAVILDSHLLEILDLTGGAAFRLSWGDSPYAVLTLGGFHPAYNPEPLVFPSTLTRLAMVHGEPSARLYLRFEGYFAITSNTMQFGAVVEAAINAGGFAITGMLGFDTLIQRAPFRFQVDIRASVRVRYRGHNLAGLTLTGALTGPGPVVLRAKVCIELLFFDICFSDTFNLGSLIPPPISIIADILGELLSELDGPDALHGSETSDPHVLLRPSPVDPGMPVLSPVGQLVWSQQRAPLDLLLQRIGGDPVGTPGAVTASSPHAAGPELDWFAPGAFVDLTDEQALTRRGFERLTGGLRIGPAGTTDGPAGQHTPTVRQIRLPAGTPTAHPASAFPAWVVAAGSRALGGIRPRPTPSVAVASEVWSVLDSVTGQVHTGLSGAQAHQRATLAPGAAGLVAVPAGDLLADLAF